VKKEYRYTQICECTVEVPFPKTISFFHFIFLSLNLFQLIVHVFSCYNLRLTEMLEKMINSYWRISNWG